MQRLGLCLCVCFMAAMCGCLVTGNTTETRSGNYVAESTFAKIEPGKTTAGWVQATLGEPTSKSTADGNEIWKYTYTQKTDNSGAVFLIFGGHNSSETTGTAFVEIKDGVVVNKWRG
jgi:outer membrane protein assembly factor BamE (lipoprotein component of BamABCDE complex)